MKNYRWSVGAAALCVLALSAYGCASDPAIDEEEDGTSSSGGKSGSSGNKSDGGKSSSSGGKSSSGGSSGRSSSSGGGNTSSGGGSSSGDVDTDAGDDEDSGTSSSSSSGSVTDGGNTGGCIAITTTAWTPVEQCGDGTQPCASWFEASFSPGVQGSEYNSIAFQFNPTTTTIGNAYTLTLANAVQRASGYAADDDAQRDFVAESGTATLDSYVNTATEFAVDATLSNVKFVEATFANNVWTPVPGGACLTLARADVDFAD